MLAIFAGLEGGFTQAIQFDCGDQLAFLDVHLAPPHLEARVIVHQPIGYRLGIDVAQSGEVDVKRAWCFPSAARLSSAR